MHTTESFEQIKGLHPITMKLIHMLKNSEDGEVIADTEIEASAGMSCRPGEEGRGYGYLMSAINYCIREYGIVWQRVRKAGQIQRLDSKSKLQRGDRERQGIRRKSKHATRILASVDTRQLNDGEKLTHTSMLAQFGALAQFSSTTTAKALTHVQNKEINFASMLASFEKK